ncbi:MAG: cation diffusion facilitator family transporter [Candidatus Nanohaloarchaea archaeon]|nr:cation diffusion facilitator family transporter [Candidatus Nanohaloarchaea archaeon]
MSDSHQHETHGHGENASTTKLGVVTGINAVGFFIELLGGLLFGSVALMSDAIHMLFDAAAYATAFVAAYIAESIDASDRWTYGLHRLEVLSALINGFLLIPMAGWIVWEAYHRFLSPVTINLQYALPIAVGGLIINLASALYLHGDEEMSLNERGAFYHLLGDAGGSIAVILGLTVVATTGIRAADSVAAILIAALIIWSAVKVLREGGGILLQQSPIDPASIEDAVEAMDGVENAHDIKCWQVCSNVNVCTVHATMTVKTLDEAENLRQRIDEDLKEQFNFQHVTIQIEGEETADNGIEH